MIQRIGASIALAFGLSLAACSSDHPPPTQPQEPLPKALNDAGLPAGTPGGAGGAAAVPKPATGTGGTSMGH